MGWALWGLAQRFGVTHELDVRFHRPVVVGREVQVRGWIVGEGQEGAEVHAEVCDARGRSCATGVGRFRFIGADKVRDAPG